MRLWDSSNLRSAMFLLHIMRSTLLQLAVFGSMDSNIDKSGPLVFKVGISARAYCSICSPVAWSIDAFDV